MSSLLHRSWIPQSLGHLREKGSQHYQVILSTNPKSTELRVSQKLAPVAKIELGTLRVNDYQKLPGESVVGVDGDYSKASHLQVYPSDFSRRIARSFLITAGYLQSPAEPADKAISAPAKRERQPFAVKQTAAASCACGADGRATSPKSGRRRRE